MKSHYLILIALLTAGASKAQNIIFPDNVFKTNLIEFCQCDTNSDGEISIQEAAVPTGLSINDFGSQTITSLVGVEHFVNLTNLTMYNLNYVTAVPDLSAMAQLQVIYIDDCAFTGTLDLNTSPLLYDVTILSTALENVILNGTSLMWAELQNNQLTDFHITAELSYLYYLNLSNNEFTNVGFFQNMPSTGYNEFYFNNNPLPTDLDLSGMPLEGNTFEISADALQHIKFPPELDWHNSITVSGANLLSVDMKNGYLDGSWGISSPFNNFFIIEGPVLERVCVDDLTLGQSDPTGIERSEANFISIINDFPGDVLVTNYCDLTSGPNTITGATNASCPNVSPLNNVQLIINGSGAAPNNATFSDASGNFTLYGFPGSVTVHPQLSNPEWFNVVPPSINFNFSGYDQNATANFCITSNGIHPDLEVSLLPIIPARPEFDATYQILVRNRGNIPLSGDVTFTYDDQVLDYVTATPLAESQSAGVMSWTLSDIQPLSDVSYIVKLNLNGPTETPAVNIGDELDFTATITPVANDETPLNNTDYLNQEVVGSFDPNHKQVLEGETVSMNQVGEYLHYIVRFQNTGAAAAQFVVVRDSISNKLDMSTFEVISASHEMRTNVSYGNKVEFFFDDINLPPSSIDEPGSNGYVAFRVKPASTVVLNDVIENKADIFFDFSFPIETNTVSTTFTALGVAESASTNFTVHPNPVSSKLNISAREAISTLEVLNLLGQQVMSANCDSQREISSDVSGLPSGVYLAKIVMASGKSVKRFVKN